MFLHIGQETVVRGEEIIGIFDIENTTVTKNTRGFLAAAEKKGHTVAVSAELPKSFVVCRDKRGKERVFISQISTATLYKRYKAIAAKSIRGR